MKTRYMTRCGWDGCENLAELNPADTENGPNQHDLEPVLCAEHQSELELIANLDIYVVECFVQAGRITPTEFSAWFYEGTPFVVKEAV